jgi:hypothetical protein
MSNPNWNFQPTPKMGGATGEAFVNTLLGTGMKTASILAREAIQNSADAQDGEEKVRVQFRRVTLTGNEKKKFVSELALDQEFVGRKKVLELQQQNCIALMDDLKAPLHLLYIEDFNTHGLYGDPHDPESHFFRLLLSLGDGAKARGREGSGGSYGYGKSVYSANSRIHTIVAYSAFNPKKDPNKHYARLMGCGYFNAHKYGAHSYTGRAWFGIPSRKERDVVEPLHDDAASKLAKNLGFTVRKKDQSGTSLLIVDCPVDCEELRSSIEEWWWPRMLDDSLGLDVVLQEQDQTVPPPRPRSRVDLKPFIHCFEMAIGRTAPAGKHDKSDSLNRLDDRELGRYGYTIPGEKDLNDPALQEKQNTIALIRAPRMVVAYLDVGGSLPLPCAGAFVADPGVDRPLKISEPAAHDKWDPNSSRLSNLDAAERQVVDAVVKRLKSGLRRFASDAAPPNPKQDVRLKSLERLLGNLFRPPTGGGGGGGYPADPIVIKFIEQPHVVADGEGLSTKGSFQLAIAEDADKGEVDAWLRVECLLVEDEGGSQEDAIDLEVSSKDVELEVDRDDPTRRRFRIERGAKPVFAFRSETYRSDWSTRVRVHVEEA